MTPDMHRVAARRPESVPALREAIVDVASGHFAGPVLDDVALVVSELLTNALQHSAPTSDIGVDVRTGDGRFAVTVENLVGADRPPPAQTWRMADPDSPSGRGLGVVRGLAPEVAVAEDDHRVAITVSWPTDP
jgi:anti-sigma regulatory factor (Ser/Thr protein kinase)